MKTADVVGTSVMPTQPVTRPYETPKSVVKKTAALGALVHAPEGPPDGAGPGVEVAPYEQAPAQLPQVRRYLQPYVDVSGKEPKTLVVEKKASRFALGNRYPLDNYAQVKAASAYFDANERFFLPEERREYCRNMVKRAMDLGIPVSDNAQQYGAEGYAPRHLLKTALDGRRSLVPDDKPEVLEVLDKIAAFQGAVPPDEYCAALIEFDRAMGFGASEYQNHVIDPYLSTYGINKQAEWSETLGALQVSETKLKDLASRNLAAVGRLFTEDLTKEFSKDPVGIYKSLPVDQRKVLANMASESGIEATQPA